MIHVDRSRPEGRSYWPRQWNGGSAEMRPPAYRGAVEQL